MKINLLCVFKRSHSWLKGQDCPLTGLLPSCSMLKSPGLFCDPSQAKLLWDNHCTQVKVHAHVTALHSLRYILAVEDYVSGAVDRGL